MSVSREMPKYVCHKEVWALKIAAIEGTKIVPELSKEYAPFEVEQSYLLKHNPQPGGYYVVYADGYKSYSPAKAFEEGYKELKHETTNY